MLDAPTLPENRGAMRSPERGSAMPSDTPSEAGDQAQVSFYLTGKRPGAALDPVDGLDLRPALFAGYRDLTKLRYDFPLVLLHNVADESSVRSLSGLFDSAFAEVYGATDGERLRSYSLRMEREIRALVAGGAGGSLTSLWDEAARRLLASADDLLQDGLRRLRTSLKGDGEVIDCDGALPARLLSSAQRTMQWKKAQRFRDDINRLIAKLADILKADAGRSATGRSAESLRASMGSAHGDAFDFAAMSRLLTKASSSSALPEGRRRRIERLLSVLRSQKFFPALNGATNPDETAAAHSFVFESCTRALEAYRERLPEMIEVAKARVMAELEIGGEYNEAAHDPIFADFGATGLDPRYAVAFPDYLVCLNARDMLPAEASALLDILSAGLPVKILLQSDDIVERSPIANSNFAIGLRSKQIVTSAIALGDVFVLQSTSANLFRLRDRIFRGWATSGAALFSIFSGAAGNAGGIPTYLIAAAALESRAFPTLVYDPSAGPDWASRFDLRDNPQADLDWPLHELPFEDEAHQRISETVAVTLVDFLACDRRYAHSLARVSWAQGNGRMVSVSECLTHEATGVPEKLPSVLMVDANNGLQRVLVDDRLIRAARRCAEMWRSLQELGGINNSHAARLLARERQSSQEQAQRSTEAAAASPAPAEQPSAPPPAGAASVPEPAALELERPSDEPYIETPRCTSCNECIQINDKMFGYNKEKQAFVLNAAAGTFRQLVEAAESCQVSIIHPGKPRDPNEAGLGELMKRAEPFL